MPIYEYKCEKCGHVDEHLMRHSDPAPGGCTKCGGAVSKLLSQTSFALKGEGWYVTDYKAKPKGAEGGDSKVADATDGVTPGAGEGAASGGASKESGAGNGGVTAPAKAPAAPPSTKSPATPAASSPSPGNGSSGAGSSKA